MAATLTYSNGFQFNKVMTALAGRIGWRGADTNSPSGRNWEDFHALVSESNLTALFPASTPYDVKTELEKAAIARVLTAVFREREFYENTLLYNRWPEDGEPFANSSLFTGYEIKTVDNGKAVVQFNTVILNFNAAATFTLRLFQDGKKTAIWSQEVTAVAGEATEVTLNSCYLNTRGNRYYFGYFQDELGSAQALREEMQCLPTKMLKAWPMYSNASAGDFDREKISYPSESLGFNLVVSSFRDHTNEIITQPALFDEAVGLQHAYMVLEQMVYSTRSNGTERILKEAIDRAAVQIELNGWAPVENFKQVQGLAQRIRKEVDRLNKQFFRKPSIQTVRIC